MSAVLLVAGSQTMATISVVGKGNRKRVHMVAEFISHKSRKSFAGFTKRETAKAFVKQARKKGLLIKALKGDFGLQMRKHLISNTEIEPTTKLTQQQIAGGMI